MPSFAIPESVNINPFYLDFLVPSLTVTPRNVVIALDSLFWGCIRRFAGIAAPKTPTRVKPFVLSILHILSASLGLALALAGGTVVLVALFVCLGMGTSGGISPTIC
jgi:hypothetical protein